MYRARISIHAPRVGRDHHAARSGAGDRISIHAPRVGRDASDRNEGQAQRHFNPRAPCGARHDILFEVSLTWVFQSTRPVWGATAEESETSLPHGISIHAPRVGRDGNHEYHALSG